MRTSLHEYLGALGGVEELRSQEEIAASPASDVSIVTSKQAWGMPKLLQSEVNG